MDVVVDVRKKILPVSTSVMLILYSRMTPLLSDAGGGDQEIIIVSELVLDPVRFWGELLGAAGGECFISNNYSGNWWEFHSIFSLTKSNFKHVDRGPRSSRPVARLWVHACIEQQQYYAPFGKLGYKYENVYTPHPH